MATVLGIHHVTAIASDPQRTLDFYTGVLGLRLVKRTVNFDDPQTYHFYFGDEIGTPGTILTFFPWPGARRGRQGVGQVAITSFAAVPGSLGFWIERLIGHGVAYEGPTKRSLGSDKWEQCIEFRDHDGLLLEIIATDEAEQRRGWARAPGIPADHALRGLHGVTLWADRAQDTEQILTGALGFRPLLTHGTTQRFTVGAGGVGTYVGVRNVGSFLAGASGAGTVHHVAWSVADDPAQLGVREHVVNAGIEPTPVIDRSYFKSVYFREPGGVLFEIATNPPGFAIDEPLERLGERLTLPPQYEPLRSQIEAALPPIHLPIQEHEAAIIADAAGPEEVSGEALGFVHRYLPPAGTAEYAGGTTLLLLHGTGGDEEDLLPLGRALLPGAGMLSPRGKVLERGMPRFFKRLAEGVFDQHDLAKRTDELARFIEAAAATYSLRRDGIIAVGFSNGANIAASLLLRRPGLLRGAVLFSPMVPFEVEAPVDLTGAPVLIVAGRADPIAPASQAERLAEILRSAGADVTLNWEPGGHELTAGGVKSAARWLSAHLPPPADESQQPRPRSTSPTRS